MNEATIVSNEHSSAKLPAHKPHLARPIAVDLIPSPVQVEPPEGPTSYQPSPTQQRFWMLNALHPDVPVCNLAVSLRLVGALDLARLRHCLNQMIEAHGSLRTRYEGNAGVIEAHVEIGHGCPWSFIDLSMLQGEAQQSALQHTLDHAARQRFNLSRPPLLRVTVVQLDPQTHVVLLVAHHIAVDGTAMFRLLPEELCARYSRSYQPPMHVPTCDALSQQRRTADASPEATADREYFKQHLHDAPSAIELPTDHPYPRTASMDGGLIENTIPPGFVKQIEVWARQLKVRPFDVLCGAFVAQLMRYGSALDVVLGSPIARRDDLPGLSHLVACCIDTMILRIRFDAVPTFAQIVTQVASERHAARKHRSASSGSVVDALGGPRDPSRNPVYQVMFNYMGFSVADVAMVEPKVQAARYPVGIAMMDLSLDVIEHAGGYQLSLEYNADVFDAAHARRMLDHYIELLCAGVREPHAPLDRMSIVTASEHAQIERFSRGPSVELPSDMLFHEMLWERARAYPAAIALSSTHSRVSYADLFDRARRLADALTHHGLGTGACVAVWSMQDPIDTLCSMFGVWLAGGVVLPIDGALPHTRVAAMLCDSGAKAYIADRPRPENHLPTFAPERSSDGSTPSAVNPQHALLHTPKRAHGLRPESAAYLMYTSGSTGQPKGVLVSHANLLNQLVARLARYDEAPHRMLAPYAFTFDSFLASVTLALANGGTLYLLDGEERRDPTAIRDLIARAEITHLDVVPSMYATLLATSTRDQLKSLRCVICGGEALPTTLVAQHWDVLSAARLFNEYGPTEATVFATVHEIPCGVVHANTPIGRPIANTECWVVDRFDHLVPLGHTGELIVGGRSVSLGYHGRDALTKASFGPIGDLDADSPWLYRTGDRARFRPDGTLELLGRDDDQIKIRGYRVELGEIEAVLRQQSGVTDAAVILYSSSDNSDTTRLVGYVAHASRDTALTSTELLQAMRARLPGYMVPSAIVVVEALPRTANGKIDRNALPAPATVLHAAATVAPRTATEAALVALWQQVLKIDGLGVDDNFFEHGGNSMLVVQLVSLIEARFGRGISVATLFREPTPAAIARLLESHQDRPPMRCVEELCPDGNGVPLVFVGSLTQGRMLAAQLRQTRRIFGLNMFGLFDTDEIPSMEVDWITDEFLREIRQVLPRGPYALAAYCEDGKIAYEMAQRLRAEGEEVPLLALIDAVWWFDLPNHAASKIGAFVRHAREFGMGFAVNKARRRLYAAVTDSARRMGRHVQRKLGKISPLQQAHETMVTRYLDALERHRVHQDPHAVILYVAQEWHLDPDQHVMTPLRTVEGLHDQIFAGPSLKQLAAHLDRDLAAVDRA